MGSNSNRRKGINDWISALPDEVLCHILSFVPTKYAMRTSVLSKRWSTIWAFVPNLDFECEGNNISTLERFLTFVDRVLSFHKADVKKFRLHCYCRTEDVYHIDGWICSAIEHKVVELDLSVCVETNSEEDRPNLELPQCIFLSKTLEVLRLSNHITYAPPASGCLLTLKILDVSFYYPDHDAMDKIFSCFHVVEDLTIFGLCGAEDFLNFKVFAPDLKTLRLTFFHTTFAGDNDNDYCFLINCPKLENLYIKQDILWKYTSEDVQSVVKASVNLYNHKDAASQNGYSDRATALLAGISNVKYLSLSAHLLEACSVPAFDNLNQLKLVLHGCCKWDLLITLLEKSPNLEDLVLEEREEDEDDGHTSSESSESEEEEHKEDEDMKSINPMKSDSSESKKEKRQWNKPEAVPICLISQLKTISIKGFKGRRDEKEMAKYLLENGEVLNKMTIRSDDFLYAKEEINKEFSMSKRGSRTCQVEFI